MISIISTTLLIIVFILFGHIIQAIKKAIGLITSTLLKILSIFGIKLRKKEKHLKVSDEFRQTYKEIKIVKLSKKNIKQQSSIDWVNFGLLVVCALLFVVNALTNKSISDWIFTWLPTFGLIKSAIDMNTMYTALLFSAMSFAATKVLTRWKDTKQQRIENKQAKIKQEAIALMSSKELLDNARLKDEKNYKELK